MLPKYHIIYGAIFSLIIYYLFPISLFHAIIIFLSSFLIDVDHYFYYVYTKKDYSLIRAIKWFKKERKKGLKISKKRRKESKLPHYIFHGVELWIILYFLSLLNGIFFFILIGILFHMILDYIEIIRYNCIAYPKVSQIYLYYKNRAK